MEWTGAVYADAPTVEVSTWIDASPERVWELVSDINVMPECSTELQRVVVGHVIPQGLLSRNSPGVGLVLVLPVGAGVV